MKGKGKGSEFEREISKRLSLWWTNNERDDIFWRSQTSGARATQRKKSGKSTANQEGDLTAMDAIGQPLIDLVSIELKRGYPEFTIEGLINRPRMKKPVLGTFIEQCERECEGNGRFWWLVVKQNLKTTILIFSIEFQHWLRKKKKTIRQLDYLTLKFGEKEIFVVRLEDFLSLVSPQEIIEG